MERTTKSKIKQPDLLITGDWHLREETPICRTDNYWGTQWKKVDFISGLQKKYNCPVVCGGDLFDYWRASPYLLSETIKHIPDKFYTVLGNHDLPQHSLELLNKCGVNVLKEAGKLTILPTCHWGQIPKYGSFYEYDEGYAEESGLDKILVWHVYTYQSKTWVGNTAPKAMKLLRQYPQFSLIITSDNHISFVEEYQGRLLVNPGSLMRMDADQVEHRPRVYLWYADTNTVEPIYILIEQDVISREHLDIVKERDNRIDAFISKLDGDWDAILSFEDNLERFAEVNHIKKSIKEIIYKTLES